MNISRVLKSPFAPGSLSNIGQRLFGRIPNMTFQNEELLCNVGRVLGRPDVGRGIMGLTAICTQPFIDYYNPDVERDTAKVSTCRTIGKIIAGTAVGCAVRSACYYGMKLFTSLAPNAPSWRKLLLPSESMVNGLNSRNADWIKNYNSTLASLIGLGVMLATNVLLDVPLTNIISSKLLKVFKLNDNKNVTNPNSNNQNQVLPDSSRVADKATKDVNDKFKEVFIDKFDSRNKWRAC